MTTIFSEEFNEVAINDNIVEQNFDITPLDSKKFSLITVRFDFRNIVNIRFAIVLDD